MWLARTGRYWPWVKYLATALDLLIICYIGLTFANVSPQMFGTYLPAFKSPAWLFLIWIALGSSFRFSPAFAIVCTAGAQVVMVIWVMQALLSEQTVWSSNPLDEKRYFPPHVAAALAEGSGLSGLGGERRRLVLLMSDIRGFTQAAEAMDPAQAVAELNRYFTAMVDLLFQTRGTLLGFSGDGILSVYGLPDPEPDDGRRALAAACAMLDGVKELKRSGELQGLGDLRIGIGLHVGEVMIGNIGSSQRMEFTVIGDAVNTAARVESMNKALGTELLITADLVADLGEHDVALQAMGQHQVKGKDHRLTLYTVDR
jgi:class 3 adenylate cyclase